MRQVQIDTICLRKCSCRLRGIPLEKESLLVRGKRVTAIAFISINGLLDVQVSTEVTNGGSFYEKLPQLQPYDGFIHQSVVIMDNCAIHHIQELEQFFIFSFHIHQTLPQ